jgi:putative membrane protein
MKTTKTTTSIFRTALLSSAITLCFVACGTAENKEDAKDIAETHNEAKYDNTSAEKDAQFLVNAAEVNLKEIKLGVLAQKMGSIKIVKNLGKMMEDAHTLKMAELTDLAQTKQMTIPVVATASAEEAYNSLLTKKGKDFDVAFCDMMVAGHKDAVSLYETASTSSKDMDIKNWATSTLPNIRMHLDSSLNCQRMCAEMK